MTDNVVSNKFTGDSSSAVKAIAELEKAVDKLNKSMVEGKSKAKESAIAAKAAAKEAAEAVAADAKQSRRVFRETVAALKQAEKEEIAAKKEASAQGRQLVKDDAAESRRVFRQTVAALKQKEKEELSAKKAATDQKKALIAQDAAESRRVLRITVAALKQAEQEEIAAAKAASTEKRRLELQDANESRRVFRQTTRALAQEERSRVRAAKDAARERKRIEREATNAANQNREWVEGIGLAYVSYMGVSRVISEIISQQSEMIRQADEFGNKQDKLSRGFALQAGLTAIQGKEAQKSINTEALRAGVPIEKATGAAVQLVSSDFSAKESQGVALQKLLEAQAASGDAEGDSEKFALSVSQIIAAVNLPKTGASIERVGRSLFALKKLSNVNPEDMEFIAPKLQGFISQGGTLEEGLATFATMKDTTNREQGATGSKIMWERLMGANGRKIEKHLGAIGLKPEQVDFIGESQLEVGKTLKGAFDKLPKEKRQPAMQAIFGGEAAAPVQGFLNRLDRYKDLVEGQKDTKGYDAAVKLAQSGSDAATKRGAIRGELQAASRKDDTTLILDELFRQNRDKGMDELTNQFGYAMAKTTRYLGFSTERSAQMLTDDGFAKPYTEALRVVQQDKGGEPLTGVSPEYMQLLAEQNKLLERNNKLIEEQNGKNAKQPAPAPVKRPAPVNASE